MHRCQHCQRMTNEPRRGLCRQCYRDPAVRARYRRYPAGAWLPGAESWTEADRSMLRYFFKRGLSDKEIAAKMGRSVGSIVGARHRLGLAVDSKRMGSHRMRDWRELARLIRAGWKTVDAAEILGITLDAAYKGVRRLGLQKKRATCRK